MSAPVSRAETSYHNLFFSSVQEGEGSGKRKAEGDEEIATKKAKKYVISDEEDDEDDDE